MHNLLATGVYMRAHTNLDSEMVGTMLALYCDYLATYLMKWHMGV